MPPRWKEVCQFRGGSPARTATGNQNGPCGTIAKRSASWTVAAGIDRNVPFWHASNIVRLNLSGDTVNSSGGNRRGCRADHGVVTEEPLGGGNNAREVVRVGDTVHRARDAGSGFAARVLAYLESAGYPYAPRYLGVDNGGRDILSYIPGQATDHPSRRADGVYTRGGAMLRLLHETTAGHRLAAGRDCVLHGDPGPFNTIFWQGLPVAFIDWSSCRPGDRRDDLGYLAWTWCIQSQGPRADRRAGTAPAGAARRVRRHRAGVSPGRDDAQPDPDRGPGDSEPQQPRLPASRRQHAKAAIAWASADRALLRQHKALLLSALR